MDARLFDKLPEGYRQVGRGQRRVKGERLPSPAQRALKRGGWKVLGLTIYGRQVRLKVKCWACLWYTATGTRLVRIVLTRDPKGRYADRAFFSTQHELTPEQVLGRFAGRWLIEVSFRDVKQSLGLGEPQNGWSRGKRHTRPKPGPQPRGDRGRRAVERTVPFVLVLRGILVVWYLRESRWKRDVAAHRRRARWYTHKTTPSFDDMLGAARIELLAYGLATHPRSKGTLAEYRRTIRRAGLAA